MQIPTASRLLRLTCVLVPSLVAAQAPSGRASALAPGEPSATPILSLWNDGTGFGLDVDLLAPGASRLHGMVWVGTMLQPMPGGGSTVVMPLTGEAVMLQPGAPARLSAGVRVPDGCVLAGARFWAQALIRMGAGSQEVLTSEPMLVDFSGPEALPRFVPQSVAPAGATAAGAAPDLSAAPLSELVAAFRGSEGTLAAAAYHALFGRGTEAIPALLALAQEPASASEVWSSASTFESPGRNTVRFDHGEPISVRRMALYLIGAIAMGSETPYAVNELHGAGETAAQREALALAQVGAWWAARAGTPLAELRSQPRPLAGASVDFGVPVGLADPSLVVPAGAGYREPRAGSATPPAFGAAVVHAIAGEHQSFLATAGQSLLDPYNALSWAVSGEERFGWVQPTRSTGASITEWLEENGWSGGAPLGRPFRAIGIVTHVDRSGKATWVHALRQNPDGSWSSKNGTGPLYPSFADPVLFAALHYPPPAGSTSVFTTWYR